ncbi:MAG: single-stranded DNA-binding protein [Clostridium perfringens]|nr:single-stranded DNA-binding protein [Clostridium perfringens]
MNKIVLLGRLVKDPVLTQCKNSEKCYTKFTIAVLRNFKTSSGERKTDFIPLVMWEKRAEIACKYLKKGDMISVGGKLTTRTYEDNEKKRRYIIEVSVDDFRIIGKSNYNNTGYNK